MTSPNDPKPPSRSLVLPVAGRKLVGGFVLRKVTGALPGAVSLDLARDDGAELSVVVAPRGYPQALARTRLGDLYYRVARGLGDHDAMTTVRELAALLDAGDVPLSIYFPHLAIEPDPRVAADEARRALAQAIVAQQTRALPPGPDGEGASAPGDDALALPTLHDEVFFDPPGIAELLAPEIAIDGAAIAEHVLRAIYLPPTGRRQTVDFSAYVLEFESTATGEMLRVEIRAGDDGKGAYATTSGLAFSALGQDHATSELPRAAASLVSWLTALVYMKAETAMRVVVPTRADELRATSVPEGRLAHAAAKTTGEVREAPALNLAIDAECGQACVFCSVKSYVVPGDRGDAELDAIKLQMRDARARGSREVRLNGIDPLAHSRVLAIVQAAAEMGFEKMSVFSPCRRLADASFRNELLQRAPAALEITVPCYGTSARVHDAVVGREGAHAEVLAALDALGREHARVSLRLSSVVVRANLGEILDLLRFARERGLPLDLRLPYPMRQTVRDVYADAALREGELVDALASQIAALPDHERAEAARRVADVVPHPCLLLRAERRSALPLFGARTVDRTPALAGTEYRSSAFVHASGEGGGADQAFAVATVPCPHVSRCALAPVCACEQYAVYAELHGMDELSPVTPAELYATTPRAQPGR